MERPHLFSSFLRTLRFKLFVWYWHFLSEYSYVGQPFLEAMRPSGGQKSIYLL
jgi:hypothetical protein